MLRKTDDIGVQSEALPLNHTYDKASLCTLIESLIRFCVLISLIRATTRVVPTIKCEVFVRTTLVVTLSSSINAVIRNLFLY